MRGFGHGRWVRNQTGDWGVPLPGWAEWWQVPPRGPSRTEADDLARLDFPLSFGTILGSNFCHKFLSFMCL